MHKLCASILLVAVRPDGLTAAVTVDSQRLWTSAGFETNLLQALAAEDGKDTILLGTTQRTDRQTLGESCPTTGETPCSFVARLSPTGALRYFRYLPVALLGHLSTLDPRGYVWVAASPSGRTVDHDLTRLGDSPLGLAKIDLRDGQVATAILVPGAWGSSFPVAYGRAAPWVVDARGALWMAGYATKEIPVTPDAIQPWIVGGPASLRPSRYPAFLLRLAHDGSRVEYGTYLGDGADAIGALVLAPDNSVYAVGSRIWKISTDGRLLWSTWLPPGAALAAAIGPTGDLFAGGCTNGPEPFFTTQGAFQENIYNEKIGPPINRGYFPNTCWDAFVARFGRDGDLKYSTLVGGSQSDLINYLSVNSLNEAFFAGVFGAPTRDISWATTAGTIGRLNADGTDVRFLTNYSPYLFLSSPGPSFWTLGEEVYVGGTAVYRSADTAETYFVGLERLRELPEQTPRIDQVQVSGSLTAGYRIEVSGAGICAGASAVIGDRSYSGLPQGSRIAFFVNPVPLPSPGAFIGGDRVTAYYDLRLRCADAESSVVHVPMQYRDRFPMECATCNEIRSR